jgi:glycosyltransferase involved in cell wall biosynthesis
MLNGKLIAVVVPAYNEETQIARVIQTMPSFVDRIIIVDDKSTDNTLNISLEQTKNHLHSDIKLIREVKTKLGEGVYEAEKVASELDQAEDKKFQPKKIVFEDQQNKLVIITHTVNGGVGAAIATGYKWCLDHSIDCSAVMAGDGQMDPKELESICRPVVDEGIDYVKGNRLIHRSAWLVIPKVRYFGNSILSILTKIASGYWHISDTQTGYTAISLKALKSVRLHQIYKSYGMPNDLLVKLNIAFCTLREVEIKPIYRVGEQSKMKIFKVIPKISLLITKLFFKRLWIKYLFRDFHPLFLLYNLGFSLGVLSIVYMIKILSKLVMGNSVKEMTYVAFFFLFTTAFQSLFFAMWMDIQDNERLYR